MQHREVVAFPVHRFAATVARRSAADSVDPKLSTATVDPAAPRRRCSRRLRSSSPPSASRGGAAPRPPLRRHRFPPEHRRHRRPEDRRRFNLAAVVIRHRLPSSKPLVSSPGRALRVGALRLRRLAAVRRRAWCAEPPPPCPRFWAAPGLEWYISSLEIDLCNRVWLFRMVGPKQYGCAVQC
ncbi:unknown protein [Oryza sativa Japonica Group]|uniref:Uncharacterized protein n=2 Tax=Oryza sativa subsp. japonica TaxID=39947 RepID=Q5ZBA3_ORYSJ|nr:unknown protein [Oryza sativa Japonica Group]BAD53200.1 unknown protein [Oryza sativa Japonica Group]